MFSRSGTAVGLQHILGLHSFTPPEKLSEQLSNKTTSVSDATLDDLSVGWTQDGPDCGFYASVYYCCEQDTLDKT